MTNTEQPGLDAGALEAARATFRKTTWEDDTAKAVVSAYLAALPAPDTVGAPTPFPYQKTFDAIAAATKIEAGHISISVTAFKEAFLASPLQLDGDRSFAASIEAQALRVALDAGDEAYQHHETDEGALHTAMKSAITVYLRALSALSAKAKPERSI